MNFFERLFGKKEVTPAATQNEPVQAPVINTPSPKRPDAEEQVQQELANAIFHWVQAEHFLYPPGSSVWMKIMHYIHFAMQTGNIT